VLSWYALDCHEKWVSPSLSLLSVHEDERAGLADDPGKAELRVVCLASGESSPSRVLGAGPVGFSTELIVLPASGVAAGSWSTTGKRWAGDGVGATCCRVFDCQRLAARRRTAGRWLDFRGSDVSHVSPLTLQLRHFGCWASQRTFRFRHWLQAKASRIGLLCEEVPLISEGSCSVGVPTLFGEEIVPKWRGDDIESNWVGLLNWCHMLANRAAGSFVREIQPAAARARFWCHEIHPRSFPGFLVFLPEPRVLRKHSLVTG
jgi:hypothetical protein